MSEDSRLPNMFDDSFAKAERESGGDNGGEATEDVSVPQPPYDHGSQHRRRWSGFHSRSQYFRHLSRSSSGYSSLESDSLPSSPLSQTSGTADKATQTPSPSCQTVTHAQQRMSGVLSGTTKRDNLHGTPFSPSHPLLAAGDMQTDTLIGQELRFIGDHFVTILDRRYRPMAVNPNTGLYVPLLVLFVGVVVILRELL